jgi:N-carbamoyl-L-amino-acid hydrolase
MLKINGQRLWATLIAMAQIGATPKGGVRRLALTEEDRRGRELFATWCREAGMTVRTDEVGNLFARREGSDANAKPVLIGSHLDTQPEGGRFAGVYGVLAALEVVRTLNDHGVMTEKPIEIVSWTNEEGARFTPAMLGSAVFVGATPLETALQTKDADGVTLREALDEIGCAGTRGLGVQDVDSYFAGTTPMLYRKDALFASAAMALELEAIAQRFTPLGLVTIGQVDVPNSSRNTIAGRVAFTVDLRHPDDTQIDAMEHEVRAAFGRIAVQRGLEAEIATYWKSPATPFDSACVDLVEEATKGFGYAYERIVSGAGHDAIHLARHVPTAMVFIPCVDGLSHNEAEDALPEDVTCGANVLINAVLARAVISATVHA